MRVENNNKAFAYRIYSHFTQQCMYVITIAFPFNPVEYLGICKMLWCNILCSSTNALKKVDGWESGVKKNSSRTAQSDYAVYAKHVGSEEEELLAGERASECRVWKAIY